MGWVGGLGEKVATEGGLEEKVAWVEGLEEKEASQVHWVWSVVIR